MTPPVRRKTALAAAAAATATVAVAAGFAVAVPRSATPATQEAAACTSSVHAYVLSGNGAVTLGYLPPGFHLQSGDPGNIGLGDGASPAYWYRASDSAEISVSPAPANDPFGSDILQDPAYHYRTIPMTIGGHPGMLLAGLSSNPIAINEVEWRAAPGTSLVVKGILLGAAQVVEVAQHATFHAPVDVELPLTPGPIVSRSAALAAATAGGGAAVAAKLTSFAEVGQLLKWGYLLSGNVVISSRQPDPWFVGAAGARPPALLVGQSWRPIWAVLLARRQDALVLVDARTGSVEWTGSAGTNESWWGALTDRAPGTAGCPGGSTAAVPFGVLTRSEVSFPGTRPRQIPPGATLTVTYKLVSVPAENGYSAPLPCDPFCALPSVDWIVLSVVAAPPGGTVRCPGPSTGPPGTGPGPLVREYYDVAFRNGGGEGCGPPPASYADEKDLAPPA